MTAAPFDVVVVYPLAGKLAEERAEGGLLGGDCAINSDVDSLRDWSLPQSACPIDAFDGLAVGKVVDGDESASGNLGFDLVEDFFELLAVGWSVGQQGVFPAAFFLISKIKEQRTVRFVYANARHGACPRLP